MPKSLKEQFKRLEKEIKGIYRDQVPFALSQSLNDVSFKSRLSLMQQAERKLDSPTKFTINGFRVLKSTKKTLMAAVYVDEKRVGYMKWQIEGGVRKTGGAGTGVPFNQKLNKFGNIPGRKKGLVKKAKQFIGTVRGIHGVWERVGGKKNSRLVLITAFEKSVKYKGKFPFYRIVIDEVENEFEPAFRKRFEQAMRSRR